MRKYLNTKGNNKSFAKEFAILSVLFIIMLAISLPITIAWFTDRFSEDAATNINFGAIQISGSEIINFSINDAEGNAQAYSSQSIFPGNTLNFTVQLTNDGDADLFMLAGCGVSIYYVPSDFTLSSGGNAIENASLIIEDAKKTNNKCINMTKVFVDINDWLDYENIEPETFVNKSKYGNMARINRTASAVLNGSLSFKLSMPSSFIYQSSTYEVMDNSENFYLILNLFVETLQAVEVNEATANSELQRMVTTMVNELGSKGFWDGSSAITLEQKKDGDNIINLIQSAADLSYLNNNAGKIEGDIELTNNIDLSGGKWEPSGSLSNNFNGQGYKITGYEIDETNKATGIFSVVEHGVVVENLIVANANLQIDYDATSNSSNCGIIASRNYGIIRNCKVDGFITNATVSSSKTMTVGAIVGTNYGLVEGCVNEGVISLTTAGSSYVGGIVGSNKTTKGFNERTGYIINCINKGNITSVGERYTMSGGIAGENYRGGVIANCINSGNLSCTFNRKNGYDGGTYCGGIAGDNQGGNYISSYIINCLSTGKQEAYETDDSINYTKNYSGGVSGQAMSPKHDDNTDSNAAIALQSFFLQNASFNVNTSIIRNYGDAACPNNYLSCGYIESATATTAKYFTPGKVKTTSVTIADGIVEVLNNFWNNYNNGTDTDLESICKSNLNGRINTPLFEIVNGTTNAKIHVLDDTIVLYQVEFKTWQYANNTFSFI